MLKFIGELRSLGNKKFWGQFRFRLEATICFSPYALEQRESDSGAEQQKTVSGGVVRTSGANETN